MTIQSHKSEGSFVMSTPIDQNLTFNDIAARHGIEIVIREDGLVVWLNIDGICRARIISNGLTVPIFIEDNRGKPNPKPHLREE